MRTISQWSELLIQCARNTPTHMPKLVEEMLVEAATLGYNQAFQQAITYAEHGCNEASLPSELFSLRIDH
jgi:hypothetical protein